MANPAILQLDEWRWKVAVSSGFGCMRAAFAAAVLLMVCAPAVSYGQGLPAGFAAAGEPAPINSVVFVRRDSLAGQLSYLQTVKYIDDGVKYIDPLSQFFISPAGEMCFRTIPNYPTIINESFYRNWCIYPQFVDRVEAVTNPTFNEVRLWCRRDYPQCAHSLGENGQISNSISASTIDYRQERTALENLIHMMGGSVRFSQPVSFGASGGPR